MATMVRTTTPAATPPITPAIVPLLAPICFCASAGIHSARLSAIIRIPEQCLLVMFCSPLGGVREGSRMLFRVYRDYLGRLTWVDLRGVASQFRVALPARLD